MRGSELLLRKWAVQPYFAGRIFLM